MKCPKCKKKVKHDLTIFIVKGICRFCYDPEVRRRKDLKWAKGLGWSLVVLSVFVYSILFAFDDVLSDMFKGILLVSSFAMGLGLGIVGMRCAHIAEGRGYEVS